jgi:hypothetical protein
VMMGPRTSCHVDTILLYQLSSQSLLVCMSQSSDAPYTVHAGWVRRRVATVSGQRSIPVILRHARLERLWPRRGSAALPQSALHSMARQAVMAAITALRPDRDKLQVARGYGEARDVIGNACPVPSQHSESRAMCNVWVSSVYIIQDLSTIYTA